MNIAFVTVTGADTQTEVADLVSLAKDYPEQVEWGLLLSQSSQGRPRFPTYRWMQDLLQDSGGTLSASGHLCGGYVRDLLDGEFTFRSQARKILPLFQRFQVNFHGLDFGPNAPLVRAASLFSPETQFIFQMDGHNEYRFHEAREQGCRVAPLFDLSHGEGVLPRDWPPAIPGLLCGYAGGLGPDNLAEQLRRIEDVAGEARIWIDMETKVRNDEDQFDLGLVRRCLDVALPYMAGGTHERRQID